MLFEPLLEFDRALGRAFSTSGLRGAFVPPADVVVTADEVKVFMDVPGLTADSLEIELENDVLTVRGERTMPYAARNGSGDGRTWQRVERGFGPALAAGPARPHGRLRRRQPDRRGA